ncbi:MAG: hypothetical protein K8S23_05560 [Candidatus Cloacimonetes bacterium]|nr:hypothetical protein [Candidatus Cloacimonadota bacterium]
MGNINITKDNRIDFNLFGFYPLNKTKIYLSIIDCAIESDKKKLFNNVVRQVCILNKNKLYSISWKYEDLGLKGTYHYISCLSFHKYWLDGKFRNKFNSRGFTNIRNCNDIHKINLDNFSLFYEFDEDLVATAINSIDLLLDEITNKEYYIFNTRAILFESREHKILVGLRNDFDMIMTDNLKYIDEFIKELKDESY